MTGDLVSAAASKTAAIDRSFTMLKAPTPYLAAKAGCRISLSDTAGIRMRAVVRLVLNWLSKNPPRDLRRCVEQARELVIQPNQRQREPCHLQRRAVLTDIVSHHLESRILAA